MLRAAAILTLAIAVGVNLAMAGLISRALLSPPAHVADPDRVHTLQFNRPDDAPGAAGMTSTSYVTFRNVRDQVNASAGAAAFQRTTSTIVIDGGQHQVASMLVTPSYFAVLGAQPAIGAGMAGADDESIAPAAVLSDGFWRSTWAADRNVIGRRFTIGGATYTIAGVMPRGFSGHSATGVDLWLPIGAAMQDSPGWDRSAFQRIVSIVVRGDRDQPVTALEAQASAATSMRVSARPILGADVAAAERRVAWWLSGVSALVFAIGLANAGTLLVVRAARRRREVAIRTALGASFGHLARQACADALMVAIAATIASLILAPWLDEAVRRVLFPSLIASSGLTRTTIGAALLAGALTAIVAAVANLWQLSSQARAGDLGAASRTSHHRPRLTTALLLLQTTVSVLLLAGAAMFGASFYRLASQDFGMRMHGVVIVDFEEGPGGGGSEDGRREALTNAIASVRALPGVTRATPISSMPFSGFNVPPISVPGLSDPPGAGRQLPFLIAATPEYFEILGIQIVQGRALTDADERGAPVVVVNETMARTVWPGVSALGKCIRIGFDPDFDPQFSVGPPSPSAKVVCREVVGVARDTRQRSLVPTEGEANLMQYYVPRTQVPAPPFLPPSGPPIWGLLVQTQLDANALAPAIRRAVLGDRRDLPFVRVREYTQLLERQLRPWRLGTTLLILFSALALTVAAVGLYAAFAHAVAERRREMAIRIAIGARPAAVLRLILREALVVSSIGAAAGCAIAVFAGRWLQSLLFGTAPSDPLVLISAAAIMLVVAVAATAWPARVASRADPNSLLRVG